MQRRAPMTQGCEQLIAKPRAAELFPGSAAAGDDDAVALNVAALGLEGEAGTVSLYRRDGT